jgi:hypothetical protein
LDSFDGLLDIKSKGARNSGGLSAAIFGWSFGGFSAITAAGA